MGGRAGREGEIECGAVSVAGVMCLIETRVFPCFVSCPFYLILTKKDAQLLYLPLSCRSTRRPSTWCISCRAL